MTNQWEGALVENLPDSELIFRKTKSVPYKHSDAIFDFKCLLIHHSKYYNVINKFLVDVILLPLRKSKLLSYFNRQLNAYI